MAKSGAIRAGRAYVELFADGSALNRGLQQAEKRLKAFGAFVTRSGALLSGLGAAITGPLLAATKVFGAMGDEVAKMSLRTGVSVEALSELGYAAGQSGTDIEALEGGLRKMQKFLIDASEGSSTAQLALSRLGLTLADLQGISPDEQFTRIADRLATIEDPALRAATAMDVFGETGTAMLPLMQNGAKGIADLRQQARDLGLVIRTEDAQAAEVFGDRLADLWKVIRSGVFTIGAALAPLLINLAVQATQVAKMTADWVRENRALIVTIFTVAAAVVAGGTALLALGAIISGMGAALGVLASTLAGFATLLGVIASPIGAVVGGLALLAGWLIRSGVAAEWLGTMFGPLLEQGTAAIGAIQQALASGNIEAAARVVWAGLQLIWAEGAAGLSTQWEKLSTFALDVWSNMASAISKIWIQTLGFLGDALDQVGTSLRRGWNTMIGELTAKTFEIEAFVTGNSATAGLADVARQNARDQNRSLDQGLSQRLLSNYESRQGTLDALDEDRQRQSDARRAGSDQNIEASRGNLAAAREEFAAAVAAAAAPSAQKSGEGADPGERLRQLMEGLAGGAQGVAAVSRQASPAAGTFSSEAGRMFAGADSVPEQQLEKLTRIDRGIGTLTRAVQAANSYG